MNGVSNITVTEDVALVTFSRLPCDPKHIAEIFSLFAQEKLNIDMISQTAPQGRHIDLSFTLACEELPKALEQINKLRSALSSLHPMVSSGHCKIQLYGEEMRQMHGVAAAALNALAKTSADLTLITTSDVDISLLIPNTFGDEVIRALETEFSVKAQI